MVLGSSSLIKKIEEIYFSTPNEEVKRIIESDLLNTLTKVGCGTLVFMP